MEKSTIAYIAAFAILLIAILYDGFTNVKRKKNRYGINIKHNAKPNESRLVQKLNRRTKKRIVEKVQHKQSIKEETLLNEDVFFIYDKEHLGGFAEYKEIKSK